MIIFLTLLVYILGYGHYNIVGQASPVENLADLSALSNRSLSAASANDMAFLNALIAASLLRGYR